MNVRIVSEYKEATINNKKNLRIIKNNCYLKNVINHILTIVGIEKERYKIKFSSRSLNRK